MRVRCCLDCPRRRHLLRTLAATTHDGISSTRTPPLPARIAGAIHSMVPPPFSLLQGQGWPTCCTGALRMYRRTGHKVAAGGGLLLARGPSGKPPLAKVCTPNVQYTGKHVHVAKT